MMEDFGDWGDESFLGLCAEDWLDEADSMSDRFERWQEHQRERELEETRLEFADEANDRLGHERDLSDIVREHDESDDWVSDLDDEDDYDCGWEE